MEKVSYEILQIGSFAFLDVPFWPVCESINSYVSFCDNCHTPNSQSAQSVTNGRIDRQAERQNVKNLYF